MKKLGGFLLMFSFSWHITAAQSIIIDTAPILYIAADRPGDFYSIDTEKKIRKFNASGEQIALATLERIPTHFDPWSGVRLFVYYAESREIQYLDPTLSLKSVLQIDSAFAIEPFLACPSGEYNYWLLDKADFSLKKVLTRESKVQTEILVSDFLTSPEKIVHMREYLNYLFILDSEKGIVIFNQLGIKVKELPTKSTSIGFYGEELYYVENKTLTFYDLYTGETRKLTIGTMADAILLLQEKMISVHDQKIEITDFTR